MQGRAVVARQPGAPRRQAEPLAARRRLGNVGFAPISQEEEPNQISQLQASSFFIVSTLISKGFHSKSKIRIVLLCWEDVSLC